MLNERSCASEDVSFFLNEVPGLYFVLGIVPRVPLELLPVPGCFEGRPAAFAAQVRQVRKVFKKSATNQSGEKR
jgi:hypothetical protein